MKASSARFLTNPTGTVDHMSRAEDSHASVRIELSDDGGVTAPPPLDGENKGPRSRRAIAAGIASIAVAVTLVAANRPDAGQTAIGTPITAPTTSDLEIATSGGGPDSELNSVLPTTTTTENSSTSSIDFESARIDFFPLEILDLGNEWIALGFGNEVEGGGLWRSTDGLAWTPIENRGFPEGDVLGLSIFDGQYVIAVDETSTWSNQSNIGGPNTSTFRISIWHSDDLFLWLPSEQLPPHEGVGFPYPVSISASAYVVPSLGPVSTSDYGLLVDYLSEVLEPEIARDVCTSRLELVDDDQQLVFLDCLDAELARVSRDEDPELFRSLGSSDCVEIARNAQDNQPKVTYVDGLTGVHEISLDDEFGLFGALIESEFITTRSSLGRILPPNCLRADDGEDVVGDVLVWTPAEARFVGGPEQNFGATVGASFRGVVAANDGAALVVGESGLWVSYAPYTAWELVLSSSLDAGGPGVNDQLSLAPGGALAMGMRGQTLFFARPGGEWMQVDYGQRNEFPVLLASTDEFAIILLQNSNSRVVKIPLIP